MCSSVWYLCTVEYYRQSTPIRKLFVSVKKFTQAVENKIETSIRVRSTMYLAHAHTLLTCHTL